MKGTPKRVFFVFLFLLDLAGIAFCVYGLISTVTNLEALKEERNTTSASNSTSFNSWLPVMYSLK
jgi:hypothetical protein